MLPAHFSGYYVYEDLQTSGSGEENIPIHLRQVVASTVIKSRRMKDTIAGKPGIYFRNRFSKSKSKRG
jgi:hypothetical protein